VNAWNDQVAGEHFTAGGDGIKAFEKRSVHLPSIEGNRSRRALRLLLHLQASIGDLRRSRRRIESQFTGGRSVQRGRVHRAGRTHSSQLQRSRSAPSGRGYDDDRSTRTPNIDLGRGGSLRADGPTLFPSRSSRRWLDPDPVVHG
jgi:hypothetical protein